MTDAAPMVIAVDGPAASGKGTIAQGVARALGFHYLDSGSLYRLIAVHSRLPLLYPASSFRAQEQTTYRETAFCFCCLWGSTELGPKSRTGDQ